MNSLILCEGKTDCILLQYYLEKVHSWTRVRKSSFHVVNNSWSNLFTKDGNSLIISETKGCSRLAEGLVTAIVRNENAAPGSNDAYDKVIIDKANAFVDTIDPDDKYLNQRRLKTKAKFDVYFSVRTAADQYTERQNILKSVAWEKYDSIRADFKVFADLG